MKKNIFLISIMLFISILFAYIFTDFKFRPWVDNFFLILSILVIFILCMCVCIKLFKANREVYSLIICILVIIFITNILNIVTRDNVLEYVVDKYGKRMIAVVKSSQDVYIEYYEYKNIFIMGKEKIILEYFGDGSFDPFEKDNEYYSPKMITYNKNYFKDLSELKRLEFRKEIYDYDILLSDIENNVKFFDSKSEFDVFLNRYIRNKDELYKYNDEFFNYNNLIIVKSDIYKSTIRYIAKEDESKSLNIYIENNNDNTRENMNLIFIIIDRKNLKDINNVKIKDYDECIKSSVLWNRKNSSFFNIM